MQISQINSDAQNKTTLKVVGRLDTLTSSDFQAQTLPFITEEKPNLTLDLGSVDYISSSGLRGLILAIKKAKPLGGIVELRSVQPDIKQIFDIAGFTTLFTFS